jgi:hypothetical protein
MRKRQTVVILVFGSVLLLLGLMVPAPPSALRLGARADEAVAQFEAKWVPIPDSDRLKYVPYRRFHLSYGSGSIDTDAALCFPQGHVWATRYTSYYLAGDGTITNVASHWAYGGR